MKLGLASCSFHLSLLGEAYHALSVLATCASVVHYLQRHVVGLMATTYSLPCLRTGGLCQICGGSGTILERGRRYTPCGACVQHWVGPRYIRVHKVKYNVKGNDLFCTLMQEKVGAVI